MIHLISRTIEKMKIGRFTDRLLRPLFGMVAPPMKPFSSYTTIVDCARILEIKEMEVCAS